jgi:transposase
MIWLVFEGKDGVMFLFRRNFSIIREQEKGDMVVMDFLLNLKPDLNSIENLWEHLKRGKVKHNPTSKDNNLWDVVNQ